TTVGGGPAAPTISDIPTQATTMNTATAAIPFTVNDADTAATSLTLSGGSSNPTLVPNGNILFGGSGNSRTVTVTPAANQTGTATAAIPFTVNDADTAATSLTLSGSSSNPTLVPVGNIVFGGSGSSRTVTVTPAANQTGTATIGVTVSDGALTANDTFVLTVNSSVSGTASFTNASAITIPDSGAGTPYPSTIDVAGTAG